MPDDRIEFISAYCDRWCERCAFTERCSLHAVRVAKAMCDGDIVAAVELAVGRPKSVEPRGDETPSWLLTVLNQEPTDAELAEIGRRIEARERRVMDAPLTTLVTAVTTLALDWLEAHGDATSRDGPVRVQEPLAVIGWDVLFIPAKIYRAMTGRDEAAHGEGWGDDSLVQNDWNGSAKVALISIERSAAAWAVVAETTRRPEPQTIGDELRHLAREVERLFPDVRRFVRPGFDQ